jgi:hypothetical protein
MMSVENIVQFVVRHNTTLIEVLIGVILVLALILMVRSFVAAKEEAQSGSSANLGDLEETLKKLLEKANAVPSGVATSADGSDAAQLVAEINTLKLELDQKKREIEDIKTAAPAGASANPVDSAGGLSDEEKAKLEGKIKELEGKLAEYEIISEDIADLSFYKEQNIKLQNELEALKAGGGSAPIAAAPVASSEAKPAAEPEIAGKTKATPPPQAEPAHEAAVVGDDLLAEFAAAIEKQKLHEDKPTAVTASSEDASAIDLGSLDMDKVIAEASSIQEPEKEINAEEALGTGVDESKLLEEAAALQNVNPEDQKLMGQFENFLKKGG